MPYATWGVPARDCLRRDERDELARLRLRDAGALLQQAAREHVGGDLAVPLPPRAVDGEDAAAEEFAQHVVEHVALLVVGEIVLQDVLDRGRVAEEDGALLEAADAQARDRPAFAEADEAALVEQPDFLSWKCKAIRGK